MPESTVSVPVATSQMVLVVAGCKTKPTANASMLVIPTTKVYVLAFFMQAGLHFADSSFFTKKHLSFSIPFVSILLMILWFIWFKTTIRGPRLGSAS